MRWVHMVVIIVFVVAIIVFAWQNFQMTTVSFFGFSVRAPLALLAVIIYVVGMVTGGSLWAMLRRSFSGARLTG
jgi:lipopolysaccharide assembly protein A